MRLTLLMIFVTAAMVSRIAGADSALPPEACSALAAVNLSKLEDAPTHISAARVVDATQEHAAFCQVTGYVAPQVGFAIRLPLYDWNRRFIMVGCGGMCGEFWTEIGVCDGPLQKGYACVVTDMGHKGNAAGDALWASNNLQAEIDYAYRATHVATLAGKAIVNHYYGEAADRSYFMGCSTGGRQGMIAAQRFPWDYDGIIAGAPVMDNTLYVMNYVSADLALNGRGGAPSLSPDALQLLHRSALARCDLDDGVADNIIGNPPACQFDPAELLCKEKLKSKDCLSRSEIAAANKVYRIVRTWEGGDSVAAAAVGSEPNWGDFAAIRYHFVEYLRYLSFIPDRAEEWKLSDFDLGRDFKRLGMMEVLYSASNPDLRRFRARGGKLMMYVGWNDQWTVPSHIIDYYETVLRTVGGQESSDSFMKLYMLPGVNHCSGGVGADAVNFLDHMVDWVERGVQPDELLSAHIDDDPDAFFYPYREFPKDERLIKFTRPLYAYPRRAVYRGVGSLNEASSFQPAAR